MRIVIEIDCQNAAFSSFNGEITRDSTNYELRVILQNLIDTDDITRKRVLMDSNGNTVGNVRRLRSRKT